MEQIILPKNIFLAHFKIVQNFNEGPEYPSNNFA